MTSHRPKQNSIRRSLPRLIQSLMILMVLLILPANIALQTQLKFMAQGKSAREMFVQMEQILDINEKDLEQSVQQHTEECIQAADMAAYFVEHTPEVISDLPHSIELAEKLGVDEVHFFSPEGEIIGGSTPQYYGYTFHTGEQMEFFLPMLEDRSLKLCQEITPNTAEGKLMQYAATWLCDGSGIVQIGVEPERLEEKLLDKSLKAIFAGLPVELEGNLHIVDRATGIVQGSTREDLVGADFTKTDIPLEEGFHSFFNHKLMGVRFNIYTQSYGDYVFVRNYSMKSFRESVMVSTVLVLCYVVVVAVCVLLIIRWYVNQKIIKNLVSLLEEMRLIENGRMDYIRLDTNVAEFEEIICYVNRMISSIQSSWRWMSYIIEKSHIPAGILEKSSYHNRLFVNQQMYDILDIDPQEGQSQDQQAQEIVDRLEQALQNPVDPTDHIYLYARDDKNAYLQIEKDTDQQSLIYYVIDVSRWRVEINHLKGEIEMDALTGLYNRRGFHHKMEALLAQNQEIHAGMLCVIDADDLKIINDTYGHLLGDRYLLCIAQIVRKAAGDNAICARIGGDEFVFFSYGHQDPAEAEQVLEILKQSRGTDFCDVPCHSIQFSIGSARYPEENKNYRDLMRLADERMYQEKRTRKNRNADNRGF